MADNTFASVMESLMKGMDGVLTTKTVVGEPVQIADTIIVPLMDVTFGIGAGSKAGDRKNDGFGGASGKLSPSAVLVIKNQQVRLVNIKNQDTMNKILDMVPDLVDRFTMKKDPDGITDDSAVAAAFPAGTDAEQF